VKVATLADPYRSYSIDYSSQDHSKSQEKPGLLVYQSSQPQVVHHGAPTDMPFVPRGAQQSQHQQHHHVGSPALRESAAHTVVPDVHHQPLLINPHQMVPSPMSSHFGANPLQFQAQRPAKRPRLDGVDGNEDDHRLDLHLQMLKPDSHTEGTASPEMMLSAHGDASGQQRATAHAFALPPPIHQQQSQQPQQQHHHHRLPNQAVMHTMQQPGGDIGATPMPSGLPSVVGQAGMPDPAPRPRGPKLKFTPEEDALLVELKEHKNLTWKQISDFFPGRTSGTLQVRYCTKLKAKDTVWTDEMVSEYLYLFTSRWL
jgi:Myb-like DNA-binding domain